MHVFRRTGWFRTVAAALLVSVAATTVAPAVSARTGATSRLYAEWVRDRMPTGTVEAVEHVLRELADTPSADLESFVDRVVRTLVREEGLAWTSMALVGHLLDTPGEVTDGLLAGLQSLGSGSLPAAALSARPDAPRALTQRTDLALVSAARTVRSERQGEAPLAAPARAVRPTTEPGRGDVQPLGP